MVVLVTGMHRSGTSAITETLIAGGFSGGPAESLIPGSFDNQRGFFENVDIVDANNAILAAVGAHWLVPPQDTAVTRPLASGPLGIAANELLAQLGATGEQLVVKDPRFCLTLPFWTELLGSQIDAVVVMYRHPTEVAESLRRRNGLSEDLGRYLWQSYNRLLLGAAADLRLLPVSYADLLARPDATLGALERSLREIGCDVHLDAAALEVPLRHHQSDSWDGVPPAAQSMFQVLEFAKFGDAHAVESWPHEAEIQLGLAGALVIEREREHAIGERDQARAALAEQVGALEAERDEAHGVVLLTTERLEKERDEARNAHQITAKELATVRQRLRDYEGSKAAGFARNLWKVKRRYRRYKGAVGRRLGIGQSGDARPSGPPRPVVLESEDAPLVSIVIPVYGQLEMTAACLASIARNTADIAYEVIVVDDASPDATAAWLEKCTNVRVVSNEENMGYLRSTNAGAALARGEFICLLNNDTEVHPGWLSAMVRTFASHTDVGLVGAKLVYGDGTLQEGGGIIFCDASGWNFGRGDRADAAEVGFVREVDYCSAACVVVRRSVWEDVGAFDERFVPAYYEDTDLAFALRARGLRVLYQPAAVVTHHEGASHGTDDTQGLKAHQVKNKATFEEKWRDELGNQKLPGSNPRIASWRGPGGRVLVIDHEVPGADQDSGSVRMTAILELLSELGFKVTFAPANRHLRQPYGEILQSAGIEVVHGPVALEEFLAQCHAEVVCTILSRPSVAGAHMAKIKAAIPNSPVIYDMVDFHGLRLSRQLDVTNEPKIDAEAEAMSELERQCVRGAALTLAITDEEAALMTDLEPDTTIRVLPNIHRAPRSTATFAERSGLLFVGSYRHVPNRDAISMLLDEIMPRIWKHDPSLTLHIVGSDLPEELLALDTNGVVVHGWVPHLDPVFDLVRITMAPLRFGAGLKGKVGDSLLRGVPVVGTDIAAEGFGDAKQAILIGSDPQALADLAISLHDDEAEWQRRSDIGVTMVEELFGYGAARRSLVGALDELGVPVRARS